MLESIAVFATATPVILKVEIVVQESITVPLQADLDSVCIA